MGRTVGGRGPVPGVRGPRGPSTPVLRARHVLVPLGRPPHGSRGGVQRRGRGGAVRRDARPQRAPSDRLGRLRAPGRERRDQARDPPQGMDVREHRAAGALVPPDGDVVRLDPPDQHLRPRVLPVDPVVVPPAVRTRSGVPEERAGQLVPQGRDGPGERAGDQRRLRAVRHAGRAQGPHPVVLQDHRLRAAAARRHRAARLAGARDDDAAQLDRAFGGRGRHVRDRRDRRRRRGVHDASRHAVGRHVLRVRARASARAQARRGRWHQDRGRGDARGPAGDAPGQPRAGGEPRGDPRGCPRGEPRERREGTRLRRALRADGVRHRRGDGGAGARPAGLRVRARPRRADPRGGAARRRAA